MKRNKYFQKLLFFVNIFIIISLFFVSTVSAAPSQLVSKGSTNNKVVALTFDDGSDGSNIAKILDILKSNNIKATFFLTGQGVNQHPQAIRNIVNQGHEIGNHSFNHPDFTKISDAEMVSQLSRTETAIKSATGKTSSKIFRAPYGSYNANVLKVVGNAGYTHTIQWTIDTIDWRGDSTSIIYNKVINNIQPGAIVLMHTGEGAQNTPAVLPQIISKLKQLGYKFVTISELLNRSNSQTGTLYTVKAGDTLYKIARVYGVTVADIVNANSINNSNVIYIGQILKIPTKGSPPPSDTSSTVKYTVKSGDTLTSIARKHNVTVQDIVKANNMQNANLIRVGQVLIIPTKSGSTTPPSTGTSKTYIVKSGDTLYRIAKHYNTTMSKLASYNNMSNPSRIYVGQVIKIP